MDRVTDQLADAQVQDLDGKSHRVGDFWTNGPALLLFVRHFG
ncbi:MAG TPA: hypothetical protein VFF06_02175 [Polyangia bacterium]|nr:hypothetical protein [Polyangia bacterium]